MRALTVCIHSGRKSDVYWLYFPNMLDLSGCLSQRNDWWLLLIVWAGRKESAGNSLLQFKLVFEPVAVLSLGIPSVTCHMRGKWWCGRPFGLLFDLEFLFPSESHLLRQSPSQVQRKKRGAGESSWLSDWNCEEKKELTNGRNTSTVTDFSGRNNGCQFGVDMNLDKSMQRKLWYPSLNVTFIFSPDGT